MVSQYDNSIYGGQKKGAPKRSFKIFYSVRLQYLSKYVDVKYLAAVAGSARSVAEILVKVVAVEFEAYCQPLGFSKITLLR